MNFRNRKLVIVVRTLFGLLMLVSGVSGLLAGPSAQGAPPAMAAATQSLWAMGLFQMIKVTEAVSGVMLVLGFLPALAAIFLAPLGIGIVIFNSQLAPSFVPVGLIVCALDAYLGYVYWDKYKALFERKGRA